MSDDRWIVQTVKNAPMTSAEMTKRKPRMSWSEPFSAR